MKRINATFYSKDYRSKFSVESTVRRVFRDANGQLTRDIDSVSSLSDNELSCDKITVKVYGESRTDVVAVGTAYFMQVYATSSGPMTARVYENAREVGSAFASTQLNRLRLAFACYDKPVTSVLVLESIEVAPQYRRQRIATSVVDYLLHIIPSDYVTAVILPLYVPLVDKSVTSPAAVNTDTAEKFLECLKFKYGHKVKINFAGNPALTRFYFINRENA